MRLTEYIHHCLEAHLKPGASVLDATAGNGHDTLKCAQLVAPDGQITAVDIQTTALENCQKKLSNAKLDQLCRFHRGNHALIFKDLNPPQPYDAILFNLGYLPGGDHSCISTPKNTLLALRQCDRLLAKSGLLIVTAYRGHPGGLAETEAVEEWMGELLAGHCPPAWCVQQIHPHQLQGKKSTAPHTKPNPNPSLNLKTPITWIASKKPLNLPKIPLHSSII